MRLTAMGELAEMKILTEGVILITKDGQMLGVGFDVDGEGKSVEETQIDLKLEMARRVLLAAESLLNMETKTVRQSLEEMRRMFPLKEYTITADGKLKES